MKHKQIGLSIKNKTMTTKEKIDFLHKYIKRWHVRWRKKHGDSVVGFRVGKKVVKGFECKEYAIIFHVKKKKKERYLKEVQLLPKFFIIKFPDEKIRKIKTDVVETGVFKLHRGVGSKVKNSDDGAVGSLGVFVQDGNRLVYALTNFHVARWSKINNNGLGQADRKHNDPRNDIEITLRNGGTLYGTFITGRLDRAVDVAFIEIDKKDLGHINNVLPRPKGGSVAGKSTIKKGNIVTVFGYKHINFEAKIKAEKSTLHTNEKGIYYENLLQLDRVVSQKGDSGALVLSEYDNAVGLIVGGDNMHSYAIPFTEVNNYKTISIY